MSDWATLRRWWIEASDADGRCRVVVDAFDLDRAWDLAVERLTTERPAAQITQGAIADGGPNIGVPTVMLGLYEPMVARLRESEWLPELQEFFAGQDNHRAAWVSAMALDLVAERLAELPGLDSHPAEGVVRVEDLDE